MGWHIGLSHYPIRINIRESRVALLGNIKVSKNKRKKMDGVWSQTELNRLIEMVLDGHTAREIADDIGTTRNAVIGKAKRKKIKWPVMVKPEKIKPKKKEARLEPKPKDKIRWQDMMASSRQPMPGEGCLFPVGDGWCGARTHGTYCAEHHGVVYKKGSSAKIHIPKETSPSRDFL